MRRTLVSTLLVAAILLSFAAPVGAARVNPVSLTDAGWTCAPVLGAVHCFPTGQGATTATISALVFAGTDPTSAKAAFLGAEHLIRADLFAGQPCPTDPPTFQYTDLRPIAGLPYFACHTYDSAF
jgi:hypothetical protein